MDIQIDTVEAIVAKLDVGAFVFGETTPANRCAIRSCMNGAFTRDSGEAAFFNMQVGSWLTHSLDRKLRIGATKVYENASCDEMTPKVLASDILHEVTRSPLVSIYSRSCRNTNTLRVTNQAQKQAKHPFPL
jgi:hypothetical protein